MKHSVLTFTISLIISVLPDQFSRRPLTLQAEGALAQLQGFRIEAVLDARAERGPLGILIEGAPLRPVPFTLAGGLAPGLRDWLRRSTPRTAGPTPVFLRVRELRLTETVTAANRITGRARLAVVFEAGRDSTALTDYAIESSYVRSAGNGEVVEQTLRTLLVKSLLFFNQWLPVHGDGAEPLARRVRFRFLPVPTGADADTVFYSPNRPLRWSDFRAPARSNTRYGAAVFTSFGYEATARTKGGEVWIDLKLKVYLVKNQSWAKASAQNDYALRHEQLHFGITRLGAERFKQRLLSEPIEPDEYDSRMQYLFLETYREVHTMQERYDAETNHSLIQSEQARWDAYVTRELEKVR